MFKSLQLFRNEDKTVESPRYFHDVIIKLRKQKRPTPLSDEFEKYIRDNHRLSNKVWYKD